MPTTCLATVMMVLFVVVVIISTGNYSRAPGAVLPTDGPLRSVFVMMLSSACDGDAAVLTNRFTKIGHLTLNRVPDYRPDC